MAAFFGFVVEGCYLMMKFLLLRVVVLCEYRTVRLWNQIGNRQLFV